MCVAVLICCLYLFWFGFCVYKFIQAYDTKNIPSMIIWGILVVLNF